MIGSKESGSLVLMLYVKNNQLAKNQTTTKELTKWFLNKVIRKKEEGLHGDVKMKIDMSRLLVNVQ